MRKRTQENKTISLHSNDFLNPNFEIIRMSEPTLDIINSHFLQRKMLDMTVELVCLHDLVKQLDPENMYLYSAEYQGFVKTPIRNKVDEGVSRRHTEGAIIRGPGGE